MASYNSSYEKIELGDGTLLDPDSASRMADSIEEAVKVAEYDQEHIPNEYNIDGALVERLSREDPSEKIQVWVEVNKSDDDVKVSRDDLEAVTEELKETPHRYYARVKEPNMEALMNVSGVFYMSEHGFSEPEV